MTRRLLLAALSTEALNEDRAHSTKGSHNELYMLTDRSAAGSALIHDQSRTINTDSDDSGYDHHGRKANNKLMNRRNKNHNHSDSDSDYGVELSNSTLVRPDADNDSDYGVEMTVLKKSTGGGAVSAKSAEKKVKKARKKRSKKSKSER